MKIRGAKGLQLEDIQEAIYNGGRLVQYQYCFSFILMSFKKSTGVYLVKPGEDPFAKSLPFTICTLLFGWWGLPWGIPDSIGCLFSNIKGGEDVTFEVMDDLHQHTDGYVFEFEKETALAC